MGIGEDKMDRKLTISLVIVSLVLLLVVGAMVYGVIWFRDNHVLVEGDIYPKDAAYLDLRNEDISISYYETLRAILPNCEIDWSVPFQGKRYADDTQSLEITDISDWEIGTLAYFPNLETIDATSCQAYDLLVKLQETYPDVLVMYTVTIDGTPYSQDTERISVSSLTEEDAALLDYLPKLAAVDAQGCTDYAQLLSLQARRPEVDVRYTVTISGTDCPNTATEFSFPNPNISELTAQLGNLPGLKIVHLSESAASAEDLTRLAEAFPNIHFIWEKTVFGQLHTSDDTEFDFSNMEITVSDVETNMRYFPNAEKVIMSDCGIDNETMAAFREKMRSAYKVVWTVKVTGQKVRTDDTIFHSSGRHVSLVDELSRDLYYCEDMIVVDVGHSQIKYIDWVKGMPNLKYLILADNWIKDITPISTCKNLVYLELFINDYITDISPLIGCTALEDVSVADTHVDLAPFAQMPWLKNLWANNCGATKEERELLTKSLPNTHIEFDHGFTTGGGWRELQNYYDMRDLMGLPYNRW